MLSSKEKIKRHFSRFEVPYASHPNWIWAFFRKREKTLFSDLVHDLKKDTCLDLGAGSCEYSKILLNQGGKKCVCVDFSPSLRLKVEEPGIEKIFCDVEKFESPKKYDLILCLGIIEFLDQPKEFMIRLKHFLTAGGKDSYFAPPFYFVEFYLFSFLFVKRNCDKPFDFKTDKSFFRARSFCCGKSSSKLFFLWFCDLFSFLL